MAPLLVALLAGCGGKQSAAPEPSAEKSDPYPLPAGKYLYLAGQPHLTVVDVDAGVSWVAKQPRLYPGDSAVPLIRRGQHLVYYGPGGGTYSIDLNLLQRPQRLDPARLGGFGLFMPSADPDRVWVGVTDPTAPAISGRLKVREVTATGRVTVPTTRPPQGRWPYAAFRSGLAIARSSRHAGLQIWDPDRDVVISTIRSGFGPKTAGPGPAYGNLLVTSRFMGDFIDDHLLFTNVVTGRERKVRLPQGFLTFDYGVADFSPNGRLLAAPVSSGIIYTAGLYAPCHIAIIDVRTGRARLIPGSRVPSGGGHVTWASDGRSVFLSGGGLRRGQPRQIVVYDLGDRSAHRIPVNVGAFFGMAAS